MWACIKVYAHQKAPQNAHQKIGHAAPGCTCCNTVACLTVMHDTYLVNGIVACGEKVLVRATAHVKKELVLLLIANLDQEAGSNLHAQPLSG